MNLSVISIGNSKGIRLSKIIIKKYNIKDEVELILEDHQIVIRPKIFRKGWDMAFKKMHDNSDDKLLIPDVLDYQ